MMNLLFQTAMIPVAFLLSDYSILCPIFWLTMTASPLILFLFISSHQYVRGVTKDVLRLFLIIILIETLIVILQGPAIGDWSPGDAAKGTFVSSDISGFFMMLILIFLGIYSFFTRSSLAIAGFVFMIPLILLPDAKIMDFCLVIGFYILFFYLIIRSICRLPAYFSKSILLGGGCILTAFALIIPWFVEHYVRTRLRGEISISSAFEQAILLDEISHKAKMYRRAFTEIPNSSFLVSLFGTGPATFGSRAANTLAADVLYKRENRLPSIIRPFSSEWTKKYHADLWTEDYVKSIPFMSAMLMIPFSGIISMRVEFGWVGLFIYLTFFFIITSELINKFSREKDVFIKCWVLSISCANLSLPFLMIFDNFHEKTSLIYPIMIINALLLKTKIN